MKIETSTITKLKISGVPRLDPVSVFIEDFEPGRGEITIKCYDRSWTAYWGSMGRGNSVAQFLQRVTPEYAAGCLSVGIDETVFDPDCLLDKLKAEVLSERRKRLIDAREARKRFNEIEDADLPSEERDLWNCSSLMQELLGDEWWYRLPTKPNPAYEYLCRIVRAVQDGLRRAENPPQPATANWPCGPMGEEIAA